MSVIIPTHNYGALITGTLKSLQNQTLPDWECIVVDDDSSDDTAAIVARFAACEPRLRYIWQKNQRQAVARNTGLAAACGKYVQFLDADDLIESRKFERQIEYLETHSDADIVYGGVRFFRTDDGHELRYSMGADEVSRMPEVSGKGTQLLSHLIRRNIIVVNSALVRRSVVDAVGFFDPRATPAEDWDYWLRCVLAGKSFHFFDSAETLALVRIHSSSSSQNRLRMYKAGSVIRKKLARSLDNEQLLLLNRALRVQDETELAVLQATAKKRFHAMPHLVNSAILEVRWRWKIKLLMCALGAPFVSGAGLRSMIISPFTGWLREVRRRSNVK